MSNLFLQKSRHHTVYYFRRRVPEDLRSRLNRCQIYKSLETCDKREAIILARALAAKTDQLFASIRMSANSKDATSHTSYVVELDLSEFGQPKSVKIQADGAEDQAAAQKALETLLPALTAQTHAQHGIVPQVTPAPVIPATTGPVPLSIEQAKEISLARTDIKPTMRKSLRTKADYLADLVGKKTNIFSIDQMKLNEIARQVKADSRKSPNTQKDYIDVIGGFINSHRRNNGLIELSTKSLKPKINTPQSESRTPFTWQQIKGIAEYVARLKPEEPHMFWVTVFVAFTGCRVEEICQIDLARDLIHDEENNIWYLNLNQHEDNDGETRKSMKKPSSWRRLPVHSALIRHGFIDFLLAEKASGFSRPFERAWPPHDDSQNKGGGSTDGLLKWSHKATKAGGHAKQKLVEEGVIGDQDKVTWFHSHRHSINARLIKQGVLQEVRAALLGQSAGGGENSRYGDPRQDHVFLSALIEKHLSDYAALLDSVLSA